MMVQAEKLTKTYTDVKALNELSFSVKKNELFGFIGPDGAGKTTLFRILTSLLLPDSGRVSLNGLDVVKDYHSIRNIVGYMPGRFSLYSDLTVEENLSFFATIFGTSIEANYDLIRDIYVQIEPFSKRLAGKLSGGMKQKLALSCALIHQPEILILDEPTTGVDAVSRKEFWELLIGLKAKGITILVSTPYMDEAIMCNRVALIQKGKILSCNTPSAIESSFEKTLYSVRSEKLYALLNDLRGYPESQSVFTFGRELHYTDKNDVANSEELMNFLRQKGHNEVEFKRISAGIEDVFMQLMKEN